MGGGALPPFNRAVSISPAPGDCIVFPPWIVHSVPPSTAAQHGSKEEGGGDEEEDLDRALSEDDLLRVSFSFNLLGRWEHTARTRVD